MRKRTSHLFPHQFDEGLASCQDPSIHHVRGLLGVGIIDELLPVLLLIQIRVSKEEAERVQPWQQHSRDNLSHSFLSEAQVLRSDNGRVDKEQPTIMVSFYITRTMMATNRVASAP